MKLQNRRECVGPRGGRVVLPTPCAECGSYQSCRPATITEPWGCESWFDDQGRRPVIHADPTPCVECHGVPSECGPCGCPEVERDPFESFLSNPEPEAAPFQPAAPFVPDQSRGEAMAQAVLPMTDAGPLFAGCPEVRR